MMKTFKANYKKYLLGGAMTLAMGAMPLAAHATPYAYGSNMITGLAITQADGTPYTTFSGSETIASNSQFQGYAGGNTQNSGAINSAVTAGQAYSGPGPAPAATFTASGPGTFTGTRAYSAIGANTGSGSTVNNAAEGYGNALGNSTANNTATILFTVTGTGQALKIAFTDAVNLIASTTTKNGENSTASANDAFSLINSAGTTISTYNPINQHVGSQNGGSTGTYSSDNSYSFLTGVLTTGDSYTISLVSASSESILPGTTTPVPEPASLLLLGTGLLGLGFVSRKRIKKI